MWFESARVLEKKKGLAPLFFCAPAPINIGKHHGQNLENYRDRPTQSQASVAQGGSWAPACSKCGRTHSDKRHDSQNRFLQLWSRGSLYEIVP